MWHNRFKVSRGEGADVRYPAVVICLLVFALTALPGCGAREASAPEQGGALETTPAGSEPATSELLTPADVERVSGLTGLRVVPYDPAIGAGGDINIADASGQLVAMLVDEGPETWDAWLTDGSTVGEPVTPPVGDESFIGPNPDVSPTPYIFGFRKGDRAVVIDTFFVPAQGRTVLTIDQLRELAAIVESRL